MSTQVTVQDLRRVADSLASLRGHRVVDVTMRPDLRQLKIELDDGVMILVSSEAEAGERPHLEVDVVQTPEEPGSQLEVGFGSDL